MRYLNKIIFINSASVKYAEIALNGNVHLIGTQGVGKSTLLRAILFFYNANKVKLGIPREKKGFDSYYFEYQNSYIIYEIVKDSVSYCVLAYKVNGKVAYRFFDSEYKKELFIDANNRAFESWEKIRNAFGRTVYYTPLIASYEDFRKIIYGDHKSIKPEFRKYSLVESKQYQNIPRTIQNVLLNSNLEAKFIKETIINSLNDEEFKIDIENYSKNHLRDFESQINDIKLWFKKNKKGQIIVRNQADKIINTYRILNYLTGEKKKLAADLANRMDFIETQKPILSSNYSNENNTLQELFKKKENLIKLHQKREQKVVSEIDYNTKELAKSKQKQTAYASLNIHQIIEEVSKKDALTNEHKTLKDEENLLKSAFGEISQKYKALISQIESQLLTFSNTQNTEIINIKSVFGDAKVDLTEKFTHLIHQIREDHEAQKEQAKNELQLLVEAENNTKRKKAELKYKTFFTTEIDQLKEGKKVLDFKVSSSKSIILNAKNETKTFRKEGELESNEIERIFQINIEKEKNKQHEYSKKIEAIETKIKQSKSSLYGWLNDTIPNWEETIGKVIDEDDVLFNTELNPKLIGNCNTFFGVELNLNALDSRIKTVKEYQQEIEDFNSKITILQKSVLQLHQDKETSLQKLKTKFGKKLNALKEAIAENEYTIIQSEEKLKKNSVELDEWIKKATAEKETSSQKLEHDLEKVASEKSKAREKLEAIKEGIKRKVRSKENERNAEIKTLEEEKNSKVDSITRLISTNKKEIEKRIEELKKKQTSELDDKGADTKRLDAIDIKLNEINTFLDYIKENETIVIEYKKDKRELFDKIPQFKTDKIRLENKQASISNEHKIELQKSASKYQLQKNTVEKIQAKIDEFKTDLEKFEEFKKSSAFLNIQEHFSIRETEEANPFSAVSIISELNEKYYKGIDTFKDLRQFTTVFTANFKDNNIFRFKLRLSEDSDFTEFAVSLKEFIEDDKIDEFEKRVNQRFAHIIHQIGNETAELISKEAEIEKIIKKINNDFVTKNFVQAIKEMEMRTIESSNPIVKLLIQIKEFNDEHSLTLGETNLFTSLDGNSKNTNAVELLKQLIKELEKYKNPTLTLSESFDLQFRIVENDNDSGWVEKLSNVGSEGTDVLVKAMINILLLNVFKNSASKKFKDFKLHCMMDEIGRLHPTNVKGILRFANERNILLINGSPTSQNATDYKYTYKLIKEQSKSDSKKYVTKVNRLVKVIGKVNKG